MRFYTPEDVADWAIKVAAKDIERHNTLGYDLNPYCTPGARNDWQRGFDGAPRRSWDPAQEYDTMYQRGKAAAKILKENR